MQNFCIRLETLGIIQMEYISQRTDKCVRNQQVFGAVINTRRRGEENHTPHVLWMGLEPLNMQYEKTSYQRNRTKSWPNRGGSSHEVFSWRMGCRSIFLPFFFLWLIPQERILSLEIASLPSKKSLFNVLIWFNPALGKVWNHPPWKDFMLQEKIFALQKRALLSRLALF